MTKKDYQLIVDALALAACDNAGRGGPVAVMDDISFVAGAEQAVMRLALALADDNPRFDAAQFCQAFDQAVAVRRRFLADLAALNAMLANLGSGRPNRAQRRAR